MVSASFPTGVTAPTPVTTTRRNERTPSPPNAARSRERAGAKTSAQVYDRSGRAGQRCLRGARRDGRESAAGSEFSASFWSC
ncbi:hypothetical protein LIP_3403 [Limnochorda pilosa]|uniref:Uncharacterized protein n=1 Tax=Limnochorda pilosa TaxID=1555112 RepID=A0A0K2SQ20_LIMPI|nr:hypothetical protein LIP_3403 [Limnochorda pilosa]